MGKKSRRRAKQKLRQKRKRRSLHRKHKRRRKRDVIMGLPFIIGFHGDPAREFWCADYPHSWELIPRYYWKSLGHPFARLRRYQKHHITSIAKVKGKVLIYKAPRR